jgi:hypothetical protein
MVASCFPELFALSVAAVVAVFGWVWAHDTVPASTKQNNNVFFIFDPPFE